MDGRGPRHSAVVGGSPPDVSRWRPVRHGARISSKGEGMESGSERQLVCDRPVTTDRETEETRGDRSGNSGGCLPVREESTYQAAARANMVHRGSRRTTGLRPPIPLGVKSRSMAHPHSFLGVIQNGRGVGEEALWGRPLSSRAHDIGICTTIVIPKGVYMCMSLAT